MSKFVPLDVVDGNGNPWRPVAVTAKRPPPVEKKNWFGGYHIYGFTQEMIDAARTDHDKRNDQLRKDGKPTLGPFSETQYLHTHKPAKLSGKPYMLEGPAYQYAELQRKAGRINVVVIRLEKK